MPTPDFILRLRERIGTQPLWLVGTTAVVVDGVLVRGAEGWSGLAPAPGT